MYKSNSEDLNFYQKSSIYFMCNEKNVYQKKILWINNFMAIN